MARTVRARAGGPGRPQFVGHSGAGRPERLPVDRAVALVQTGPWLLGFDADFASRASCRRLRRSRELRRLRQPSRPRRRSCPPRPRRRSCPPRPPRRSRRRVRPRGCLVGRIEADWLQRSRVSAGQVSAGQVSAGQVSAGQVSAGRVRAGEVRHRQLSENGRIKEGHTLLNCPSCFSSGWREHCRGWRAVAGSPACLGRRPR